MESMQLGPILYVEDEPLVQRAILRQLRGLTVDVTTSVASAAKLIARHRYAAWLVDVGLPDGSGLDLLSTERARGNDTPVLVVTGAHEWSLVNRTQLIGGELAVKPDILPAVTAFLGRVRDTSRPTVVVRSAAAALAAEARLTARETELLQVIARGTPRARLSRELALSENTVKTTVRRLLAKLGCSSVQEIVRLLLAP